MKNSRRCKINGAKHGAKTGMDTEKNPMYTSKVYTSHERTVIQIPKTSKIYQYLYVNNNGSRDAKWKQLDSLITVAEKARANAAVWIFEDFLSRMIALYPEKRREFDNLRPLIFRKILKGEKLDNGYFEILREL